MRTSQRLSGYWFLAPYLLIFSIFLVLPLFYGLALGFMRYDLLSPEQPSFVGVANYREALADENFQKATKATLLFVVMTVPATVGLAMLLALGIEAVPQRRQGIYRAAIFLPTMITISVAGILWRWFYNSEFGVFNAVLSPLGLKIPWISDERFAMPSIVLMTVWWTVGGPMVILLAGLKQIPTAYYEAGEIDGATGWRRFAYITLPLLRPVLLFVVILNMIGAFQVFGQTFIITKGGPERATRVLVQYIYETSFNFYRMGYGAAMSWILFAIISIVSIAQFKFFRER
jgi:multiple sugar transport system permease protein